MKTQHTPGPWTYIYNGNCLDLKGNCGNTLIAEFPTLEQIEGVAWKPSDEESANLRLIAAAPELLEALQAIESVLGKIPAFGDTIGTEVSKAQIGVAHNQARQAISKAIGRGQGE